MRQQLLDTHTFLWFVAGSNDLSRSAREAIEAPGAKNHLSIVSLWEIAVKVSLGKLNLHVPFAKLQSLVAQNEFHLLPVSVDDTAVITTLPFHHRDPFDRMLVAQAMTNKLTILTKDGSIPLYEVQVIW